MQRFGQFWNLDKFRRVFFRLQKQTRTKQAISGFLSALLPLFCVFFLLFQEMIRAFVKEAPLLLVQKKVVDAPAGEEGECVNDVLWFVYYPVFAVLLLFSVQASGQSLIRLIWN